MRHAFDAVTDDRLLVKRNPVSSVLVCTLRQTDAPSHTLFLKSVRAARQSFQR
jgi:hypothetical protein